MNRNPLVIDTDAGADDLMSIAYLLSIPSLTIESIVVIRGLCTVHKGVDNIRRYLQFIGRNEIKVYAGEHKPMVGDRYFPEYWTQATDQLKGVNLPVLVEEDSNDDVGYCDLCSLQIRDCLCPGRSEGVRYLRNRMYKNTSPFQILALGPLTNIALAMDITQCHDIPIGTSNSLTNIVLMGGSFFAKGNLLPDMNQTAEWNIYCDPVAADLVLKYVQPSSFSAALSSPIQTERGIRTVIIGLDATNAVPIDNSFVEPFVRFDSRLTLSGRFVKEVLVAHEEFIQQGFMFAWDMLAAMFLVEPACIIDIKRAVVSITTDGFEAGTTIISGYDPASVVEVALSANKELFYRQFIETFIAP